VVQGSRFKVQGSEFKFQWVDSFQQPRTGTVNYEPNRVLYSGLFFGNLACLIPPEIVNESIYSSSGSGSLFIGIVELI
jgi:hypothetical protein